MSTPGPTGLDALQALIAARADLPAISDKDWSAAAGVLVKRLLIAAGQTVDSLKALRTAVGGDLFETQLKSLTHHQAKLLARRLDKSVPDLEVSTAAAAAAWVRQLLAEPAAETAEEPAAEADTPPTEEPAATEASETPEADPAPEDAPTTSPNPYFGRRSFRTS